MKKTQNIALALALVMSTNTVAFAKEAAPPLVDKALIEAALAAQDEQTKATLAQVEALINSVLKYKEDHTPGKQSAYVNLARVLISLLGVSSGLLQMKNRQAQTPIELTFIAFAGALSTFLDKLVTNGKIDIKDLRDVLLQNQTALTESLAANDMDPENAQLLLDAVSQIGAINAQIEDKAGEIQKSLNDGQTDVAIVAVITIVLNYAAPILPKSLREALATKAPNVLSKVKSTAKKGKDVGVQSLAGTNVGTLLSTLLGVANGSPAQMNMILTKLNSTRAQLIKQARHL